MKKIFMFIAACTLAVCSQAQIVGNDYDSPITSANGNNGGSNADSDNIKGTDVSIDYSSDAKYGSIAWGSDVGEYGYVKMGVGIGIDDFLNPMNLTLGIGAKKRCLISDDFLIQGMIYPYAGLSSYNVKEYDQKGHSTTKEKYDFTYGAAANLSVGLRLWETKKGNSTFVTLGYYISAPKFKTENMFKQGSWGIGFTTILN